MWLADSNILIRAASAPDHPLQLWLQNQLPAISIVTRIEVLGFISTQTATLAIDLRRQRKMSLGDALVAATCLEHGFKLATRNTSDFDWIAGLTVDGLAGFAA